MILTELKPNDMLRGSCYLSGIYITTPLVLKEGSLYARLKDGTMVKLLYEGMRLHEVEK